MPPLPLLLAYRFLGWRLGPSHRDWVHRDITRPWYVVRQGFPVAAGFAALLAVVFQLSGSAPERLVLPVLAVLVLMVFLRRSLQDRALRQQGLTADGEVEPAAKAWYADPALLRRRNLTGAASTLALVAAALVVLVRGPAG